ncbi:hypothetical protein PLICRDRAFT_576883 [Plicaturopsis crispa FD-325 SS-3]|nr:hypothetical protein PLICRDRAFT_576883 [Plicaturopsis crispa FD-325 SS-3]
MRCASSVTHPAVHAAAALGAGCLQSPDNTSLPRSPPAHLACGIMRGAGLVSRSADMTRWRSCLVHRLRLMTSFKIPAVAARTSTPSSLRMAATFGCLETCVERLATRYHAADLPCLACRLM